MLRNKSFIFFIIYIFTAGNFLLGQQAGSSSGQITIIANYKEETKEIVFATGNVEIHYYYVKLFADRAELNTETKDVYAQGNVVIQLPGEVVSVEEISMNLDSW